MKNLIEIFEDTKQYTLDNNLTKSITTKHTFSEIEPAHGFPDIITNYIIYIS